MSNYTPEQLASLQKERPKNETEKRFVLSPEEFSKERFVAIKEEVDEIKQKYPEVLSLCMFGSMVKGTAHEESDIDGYLFVDSELAAQRDDIPEEQILNQDKTRNQSYFSDEAAQKYILEFRNGLKEKADLVDEDVEHIRPKPISEKVIDDDISNVIKYYRDTEKFKANKKAWQDSKPPRGSEINVLLEHEKNKPEEPKFTSASLGSMFHLDVGGGIRKYRKMFVGKISQLGPDGEKIWAETIGSTERLENNLSKDPSKRYPRTLAEAMKVYRV